MKRFLTVFFLSDTGTVHLYKDVGGIPYALAKYCGWESTFAYSNHNETISNAEYEKYVQLKPINVPRILNKSILRYLKYLIVAKYVYFNASKYDVINFYHAGRMTNVLCKIAKLKKPNIITYIKLDMGKASFCKQFETQKGKGVLQCWQHTDLFTVETDKYVEKLNDLDKFNHKVKYLPNGFFSDLVTIDKNIKKEKIILTVGRLGTAPKNTEMLVEAIENIKPEKLQGWKVYLVGSMTEEFKNWMYEKIKIKPYLKEIFVTTGNISDKKELYTIYARSSIFILPSRNESWGLAVTEAMSFGCYPIVTDCCDAFDEIINKKFGKIIPNEDEKALQQAIEEVLNKKIDYLEKGEIAKNFADRNLDWQLLSKKLNIYLEEIKK